MIIEEEWVWDLSQLLFVLMADSERQLRSLVKEFRHFLKRKLKINAGKSKIIKFLRELGM